jgi:hypothetical protein
MYIMCENFNFVTNGITIPVKDCQRLVHIEFVSCHGLDRGHLNRMTGHRDRVVSDVCLLGANFQVHLSLCLAFCCCWSVGSGMCLLTRSLNLVFCVWISCFCLFVAFSVCITKRLCQQYRILVAWINYCFFE